MSGSSRRDERRRLTGGAYGPLLAAGFAVLAALFLYGYYLRPCWAQEYGKNLRFSEAMFGPAVEQPIAFSHRLHVTDKEIDCRYCHSYVDRSVNAGLPSVMKCLGCHDHIIPEHQEIRKLRGYRTRSEALGWRRVYYNPDHVYFPHYRHVQRGVECTQCHGAIERVDRLHKVTFYMGFCIDCHEEHQATRDCAACHQ